MSQDAASRPRRHWLARVLDIDSDSPVQRIMGSVMCGVGVMGVGAFVVKVVDLEKDNPAYNVSFFISLALATTVGWLIWTLTGPTENLEQAGRQRVRDAERSLEEALRARQGQQTRGPSASSADPAEIEAEPSERGAAPTDDRAGGLALPELWTLTHTRLDAYHEIALAQAKRSFRNAQAAMALGFALLLAFVFVALNASTTAGAVVAGGLGAVSAALAGYVSRTFVVSQTASAAHLRAYFDQPLEFARYLAAERIIVDGGLDQAQRAEVLTVLVQAMVTPAAGASGPVQENAPTP